ncbi:inositol-tetrakisphosphate 1-kinase-like [Acipenser ruthenus]|uniref:inositol-tetrakisphosphate 1-kinase-like n=1 Tax=Acipenser ruthenus TaxID=7906 RepID=UPI00145A1A69|nr:inositol-tetrakisphosphate 1-kinase-like [Acipenser ruthenus]XP_058843554.1 inositol-tetrakisphosphate 1-kinase-like [Acipenser ruthenus]
MQTFLKGRRVGYWLSEKKIKKLHFQAFAEMCRKRGIEVVQLDLTKPIEEQGPLDVIIHKLTDLILEADQNDTQSLLLVQRFQDYIEAHPETIVLDPLPAIRTLLDRCKSYELIHRIEDRMQDGRICSPPFMVLTSECGPDTLEQIEKHRLTFPFICKTRVAHGTNSHEMAIIFNEEGLKDIKPPCVIQSFINHNAVLYKVFVVGESYTVVERPSLKNFPAGPADRKTIFFNSHNVSKPESSSDLTSRDNVEGVSQLPNDDVIREMSRSLCRALGVSLFGIDVIINNQTGQHAVIDINAFPGYEGVPEFFSDLLNHITAVLQGQTSEVSAAPHNGSAAEQVASVVVNTADRSSGTPTGCCSMLGKDANPWILEGDSGGKKASHQRLGCNSAMSPNFQQHCVATLATKASSQ